MKWLVSASVASLFSLACSGPDSTGTTALATSPQINMGFVPLEEAMGSSCASLDCHGQAGRNLRLYDVLGLRLSPTDTAGTGSTTSACGTSGSTCEEIGEDEESVLGLEPALTAQVIADKGANPERLTIVRKARGVEEHKGGIVWPEGSDGDLCLRQWLSSTDPTAACARTVVEFSIPQ